jgi:hypothetical protein
VDRHRRVLVSPVQFVAFASGRPSDRGERRLVVDDHLPAWQGQFDSNVKPTAMLSVSMRYLEYDPAADDCRMERIEPCHARADLLLERRSGPHLAEADLNWSRRHNRQPPCCRPSWQALHRTTTGGAIRCVPGIS